MAEQVSPPKEHLATGQLIGQLSEETRTDPDQIETEIAKHTAELEQTVVGLRKRLDVTKQYRLLWDRARQRVENNAAVAADNARIALVRAQNATPREWVPILAAVPVLVGGIMLIDVTVRRKNP